MTWKKVSKHFPFPFHWFPSRWCSFGLAFKKTPLRNGERELLKGYVPHRELGSESSRSSLLPFPIPLLKTGRRPTFSTAMVTTAKTEYSPGQPRGLGVCPKIRKYETSILYRSRDGDPHPVCLFARAYGGSWQDGITGLLWQWRSYSTATTSPSPSGELMASLQKGNELDSAFPFFFNALFLFFWGFKCRV